MLASIDDRWRDAPTPLGVAPIENDLHIVVAREGMRERIEAGGLVTRNHEEDSPFSSRRLEPGRAP